jgi:hypothetical protein
MSDELQMVMALEDARVLALCEQDDATLDGLLSDSMVYVHSTGLLDTKQSFLEHVRNGPIQYRSFDRSDIEAYAAGDSTVIVRGVAVAGIEFDGKPIELNFRYLAVWVKHSGSWRFEAWQSSTIS